MLLLRISLTPIIPSLSQSGRGVPHAEEPGAQRGAAPRDPLRARHQPELNPMDSYATCHINPTAVRWVFRTARVLCEPLRSHPYKPHSAVRGTAVAAIK
jgi:hypothetical protein